MALVEKLDFLVRGDERGFLVPIEPGRDLPFEIRRIYYLYNTISGIRRGLHAHHKLRQAAACLRGHCTFLLDDGHEQANVILNSPSQALMIEPMVWHEMFDFSDDAVLLVLADGPYDEADYIRSRTEFDRLAARLRPGR
jgi:dTDP-4-dehydrorhamnose 3,5-epimerase-like enzyme